LPPLSPLLSSPSFSPPLSSPLLSLLLFITAVVASQLLSQYRSMNLLEQHVFLPGVCTDTRTHTCTHTQTVHAHTHTHTHTHTAGEGAPQSLHEVCGARLLLRHLSGPAGVQRLGPLRGHHHDAQRDRHRPPPADLPGQDHALLLDR